MAELIDLGIINNEDKIELESAFPIALTSLKLMTLKQSVVSEQNRLKLLLTAKLIFIGLFSLAVFYLLKMYQKQADIKRQEIESKEQFIHFVSHELKTPLASISLMSETLLKRQQADLPIKDYPHRIVNESDRLNLMVDNLLTLQGLSQRGSRKQSPHSQSFSLQSLVFQVASSTHVKEGIDLCVKNELDVSVNIVSEPQLINLVIKNLIDNAIKYCEHQQVKICFRFDEKSQQLVVSDNGKGIALNNPQRVFESFVQGENAKQGFGLGLTLCKTIMQHLGGDIYVAKTGIEGTTWHIDFTRLN